MDLSRNDNQVSGGASFSSFSQERAVLFDRETVGGAGRARMASVNGAEEVYYSDDSDDEAGPFSKQSKALQM